MSNLKISQLPQFTGNTSGSFLVMNNSGETTTYKVLKENYVFPYNGNATITGSLYSTTGSLKFKVEQPSSGFSFLTLENNVTSSAIISSGSRAAYITCKSTDNDSIFFSANSGSGVKISDTQNGIAKVILSIDTNISGSNPPVKFARDLQITGSLSVSGSITSNLIEARNGTSKFDTINMDNTMNGNYVKGVAYYGYSNLFLYADGGHITLTPSTSNPYTQISTGSLFIDSGDIIMTGSAKISKVLQLQPLSTLPSGQPTGSLAVSGSNLFFYNGAWSQII